MFFMFACLASKAQTTNDFFSIPKTYPVAPSAYEFMKYGEIPVSKYTGVPNISIPIYTIEAGPGDLQVPISLTYHSNGFKVNEEAGWTGLGWTLNTGGHIIQIVNGYDDFKTTHPNRELPDLDDIIYIASNGYAPQNYWTDLGCHVGQTNVGVTSKKFGALQYGNFDMGFGGINSGGRGGCYDDSASEILVPQGLFGVSESYDYEPDVFKFNFLGYSGKFVLDWETETFKCLTDPKIKVEKNADHHKEITITTPEGHIFVFKLKEEAPERGEIRECTNCEPFNGQNGNEAFFYGASSRVYKLVDIYTNKGNHISYAYTNTPLLHNLRHPTTEIVSKSFAPNRNFRTSLAQFSNLESYSYVSDISFNGGSVQFLSTTNRLDFMGAKKLNRIEIHNTWGGLYKAFDLNYNYFIGHSDGTHDNTMVSTKTNQELTHRLKLTSVKESGKPAYIFEYNTTQLPSKHSRARDYWGYYNGVLTNKNNFPNVYRFNYGGLPVNRNWGVVSNDVDYFTGNNRSSRLEYTKAGVLEKIIYPTGGYAEFDYELNSFTNAMVPNFTDTESTLYVPNRSSYGAGLRIKEIKSFESDNNLATSKTYTYEGGRLVAPILFVNKVYTSFWYQIGNSFGRSGFSTTAYSNSLVNPSILSNGNFIGYSSVSEHLKSNENDTDTIGEIKYVFENHESEGIWKNTNVETVAWTQWNIDGPVIELNVPLFEPNEPTNGSLKEQYTYNNNGDLQHKIVNTYSSRRGDYCTYGVKAGPAYNKHDIGCVGGQQHPGYEHMLTAYAIGSLYTFLDSTEDINYYDGGEVSSITEYEYNDYHQMKEEKVTTSNGEVIKNSFFLTGDAPLYRNHNFYTGLRVKTMYRNDDIIDQFVYKYETRDVPSDFPNADSYRKLFFVDELRKTFENKVTNLTLNDKGLITMVENSDTVSKTYYVWGYNDTKIIAKIENYFTNSNYAPQIQKITNAQDASDFDYDASTSTSETNLKTKLNILRGAFPESQVTTYTYDPLIGVTSITDPRGATIYYEYDDFNRLKHVKDKDGHILSENDYHYKPQN